jgi:cytochrome c556
MSTNPLITSTGVRILAASIIMITASPAFAQFQKPEDAIKYRQSAFSVMGTHFGRIGAVVKGEVPYNKDDVAKNVAIVATLSTLPWQAFGAGTEGGKAQPAIWTEAAKFKAGSEKMQTAVAELNQAAQSGNLDNIKKAFSATGQTCKACHDDFRKK